MKISGKYGLGSYLKIFLKLIMIMLIVILLFFFKILNIFNVDFDNLMFIIYPCGVFFLVFVYQFIGLFDSLSNSDPFCRVNVRKMKTGMVMALMISLIIFISFICVINLEYTVLLKAFLLFISALFLGAGIALYILSELFKTAINYKEENDLMI